MAKHQAKKIVCDIPLTIINVINEFRISNTEFSNNSQFFNSYFIFYLSIMDKVPSSQFLLFSQMPDKSRNNFSFYLNIATFQRLELLSAASLRDIKNQATHMVFSIYFYIVSFHNKPF